MGAVLFHMLTIMDFKAFRGTSTVLLDQPGVTFVRGENRVAKRLDSNGSSKSSIWDALCWVLTGRTPLGLRNPDIMPWGRKTTPTVELFLSRDGARHIVKRTASPNRLTIDGEEAAQAAVDALTGQPFELLVNTTLLAQERPLFFDKTSGEKMELLSETLFLSRWDAWSEAASQAADDLSKELQQIARELAALHGSVSEAEGALTSSKEQAARFAEEARARTRDAEKRRKEFQKQYDALDKELAEALLAEDGAGAEYDALMKERDAAQTAVLQLSADIQRREGAASATERRIEEIDRELAKLGKTKACPVCGQAVTSKHLAGHRKDLEADRERLCRDTPAAVPEDWRDGLSRRQERLASVTNQALKFREAMDTARAAVRRLDPKVRDVKSSLDRETRAAAALVDNPHTKTIQSLSKRIGELNELLKLKLDREQTVVRELERTRFWVKGFRDIKLQLIDDVLQELQVVTNGMLEAVGLVGWEARYAVERETKSGKTRRELNVEISSPQSKGFVRWESWSGGERQRLRLVGTLALTDVLLAHAGVKTNLEILDEPAVYWSAEGVQDLCAFLSERARESGKSIFYTEHNVVESTYFARTLTVVNDAKGAFVQ